MRVPPQKGLESSSRRKFFFFRKQAASSRHSSATPVRLPSTERPRKFIPMKHAARRRHRRRPNAHPSTERSRKFFSNKVFFFWKQAASSRHSSAHLPKKVFLLLWSTQHAEGIVGVPMRVPPQKGLESSSGRKFFFFGKQAASSRHCRRPNARPSTERSRKFFSNKVFLLGVAGSTQNRHSSARPNAHPSTERSRKFFSNKVFFFGKQAASSRHSSAHLLKKVFLLLWTTQHAEGIVGVPMRVPPQKGLESSSQTKFSSSGNRQQAVGIAVRSQCPYHPQKGLESSSL